MASEALAPAFLHYLGDDMEIVTLDGCYVDETEIAT